jgi:hypothetical protein
MKVKSDIAGILTAVVLAKCAAFVLAWLTITALHHWFGIFPTIFGA